MDDIQTRLQDTSQNCLKAHAAWVGNKKDAKAQETLQVAIHELRKVCSRLEIELAISERDQMTSRPLPIPAHRASKGRVVDQHDDMDDDIGNGNGNGNGNNANSHGGGNGGPVGVGARRRRSGGGSQGGSIAPHGLRRASQDENRQPQQSQPQPPQQPQGGGDK